MTTLTSGNSPRRTSRRLTMLAAALLLAVFGSGCLRALHPIHPPAEAAILPAIPCACKEHVYVFLVHGLDPLDYANLGGLKQFCHDAGFPNVYLGQLYHGDEVLAEIRRIHVHDAAARFVLVGFSAGANVVRSVANQLGSESNLFIDLVVYAGGNTLKDEPESKPANVGKVVNVLARGWVWNGAAITGAENVNLTDAAHFGSPSHPETLRMLTRELADLASQVTVPEAHSPAARPMELPTTEGSKNREMRDILRPVSRLREIDERTTQLIEPKDETTSPTPGQASGHP